MRDWWNATKDLWYTFGVIIGVWLVSWIIFG